MNKFKGFDYSILKRAAAIHLMVFALVAPFTVSLDHAEAAASQKKVKKTAKKNTKKNSKKAKKVARKGSKPQSITTESASTRGGTKVLDMKREQTLLPAAQSLPSPTTSARSLMAVKPPRSGDFYQGDSKEAEYEQLVDKEIAALYKLTQQNRRSQNRGEFWLRLGERYVEKARLVHFRAQAEYDRKLKDYNDKKTSLKPSIDSRVSRDYNQKAVQLYEWFIKDFPNDSKADQALYFLGYNYFELGDTQKGEQFYEDLIRRFPDSVYVLESHFALGEFYFENEKWQVALDNYMKVIKAKKARLNTFATFKAAWCLYRLNRTQTALTFLERVVRLSQVPDSSENVGGGRKAVNKIRLASEAMKDYVPFYAEVGETKQAANEFRRIANGNETEVNKMLERLAYIYADSGNRTAAAYIFKQLIYFNPNAERAAEYQHQVVLTYATSDQKEYRREVDIWLESFGPNSSWAKANSGNEKLVQDVAKLQESTLRNYVLRLHQAAQNSRAPYSQKVAAVGYEQYLRYFPTVPQSNEMRFFQAELLYDMERYEESARVYMMVAEQDPQGKYRDKAVLNALIALEKELPTSAVIDEKRGDSLEKIPLDPEVVRFERATALYLQVAPKSEKASDVQRRLGVLYYGYNHFDRAIEVFEKIINENPRSPNAEVAGNLILDIYKLRGDMAGFTVKGQQLLANPAIARTKFGEQVRGLLEKASYMKAEKSAEKGDMLGSAKEFEFFSVNYKQSDIALPARFRAGVNYEKGGDLPSAIRMYNQVLMSPTTDPKMVALQSDSRNNLARIYQQLGQLESSAKQYESFAQTSKTDPKAVNAYFNAGVLWDSLGEVEAAERNYQSYFDLSKKADRTEVLFSQAEMFRKKGQYSKATALYDQYLRMGTRDEGRSIQAAFMIAWIADRADLGAKARQWYGKTIEFYKRSGKKGRDEGVRYAAEARFSLARDTMKNMMSIRFTTSDAQQGQAAKQVKAAREKYIAEMKEVILYDYGPFIIAALASTGQMFDGLVQMFSRIPVPVGYEGEDAKKFKQLLQGQIEGLRAEAKNSYKAAVDKAKDIEVWTPWVRVAQEGLAARDPSFGFNDKELVSEVRSVDWMGL